MNQVHTDPVVTQLHSELSETIDDQKPESDSQIIGKLDNVKNEFKSEIVWLNALFFLLLHIIGIYGFFKLIFLQSKLATTLYTIIISYLSGGSITIGAHRLWSHRSYKAKLPLKIILLIGQTSAGQNSAWEWARDHRQHHKYSDTDADPHNSKRGFFFCHIGWLMYKKHPEVIEKGKIVDMSDLEADPWIMFQKRHFKKLYFLIGFLIPTFVPVILWQETISNAILGYFARYVSTLNVTWCVNSVAHFYGTKPYNKNIPPTESPLVSFLTSGEGWHNYHHSFPWDYKASEFGRSYNANSCFIEWCERQGLAFDLKTVTPEMIAHKIITKGDGTLRPDLEPDSLKKMNID